MIGLCPYKEIKVPEHNLPIHQLHPGGGTARRWQSASQRELTAEPDHAGTLISDFQSLEM